MNLYKQHLQARTEQLDMILRLLFVLKVSLLAILFLFGKAIIQCRILDDWCENTFVRLSNTRKAKMKKTNYWHTLFGWKMFKSTVHTLFQDLHKTAWLGQQAPDPAICTMDGNQCMLMDQHSFADRPLVLIFGSCTCPPFMASLAQLDEIVKEFAVVADFILVYVDEAHAEDEWKFKVSLKKKIKIQLTVPLAS